MENNQKSNVNNQFLKAANLEIVELLDEHVNGNFDKSFHDYQNTPINPVTKNKYSGINQILLNRLASKNNYSKNHWLPFNDIKKVGGSVIKGKKAQKILKRYKFKHYDHNGLDITEMVTEAKNQGKELEYEYKTVSNPITYPVFNIEDTKDMPPSYENEVAKVCKNSEDIIPELHQIINNLGIKYTTSKDMEIQYERTSDKIFMPELASFETDEEYINKLLPLIAEATCHKDRLDRKVSSIIESKDYLKEKLANELTASSLSNQLGFRKKITDDVELIEEWKRVINSDPYLLLKSCNQMKQTIRFIHEKGISKQQEIENELDNELSQNQKLTELEIVQTKQNQNLEQSLSKN